jgi:benzodiazapine receptor
MSPTYAIITSVTVCLVAAACEGLFAGKNVRSYLAGLKQPRYSPPLWVWTIIGGLFYVTFCFVLYRVLRHEKQAALRTATMILIFVMMSLNALWNYLFFRARRLFISLAAAAFAPVMDIALLICLARFDRPAMWALIPYLLYRVYSLWWIYGLWQVNYRSIE